MILHPPPNGPFATVWLLAGITLWLNVVMGIANAIHPPGGFDSVRHVVNLCFVPLVLLIGYRNAKRTFALIEKNPAGTREGAGEVVSERR